MVRKLAGLAMALLLATAACGSGGGGSPSPDAAGEETDISGWYQVTSHLEGACGAPVASSLPVPYLWVDRLQSTFYLRACMGTATSDCTGTFFYDFTKPIEGGWAAEGGSAFYSAGCTLSYERATATLSGDVLRARSLRYTINRDLPQSECTLTAARALSEPCTHEVELTASRI